MPSIVSEYVPRASYDVALWHCPFCGQVSERLLMRRTLRDGYDDGKDPDAWAYYVFCTGCAAQGGWQKSASSAARCWNMRAGT